MLLRINSFLPSQTAEKMIDSNRQDAQKTYCNIYYVRHHFASKTSDRPMPHMASNTTT